MFFLLRLGFWITLICLFLPSSRDDNRRLIRSAEQTVNDMRGFCERNPQVCDDVRISMTSLLARFKSGAELIQTWLAQYDKEGGGEGAPVPERILPQGSHRPGKGDQSAPQPVTQWHDSLNFSDKQVPWRGPAY